MRKFIVLLALSILLAGCSFQPQAGEALPSTAILPQPTFTFTVPPLPTVTLWSTKTPRPTKTATPTPLACWQQGGKLVAESVPSALLPDPIKVLLYLPPCYAEMQETTYPSLVLLHGQGFDQNQWVDLGFTTLADSWAASNNRPSFLIVMPLIENWAGPLDNPFGKAVVEEVIPYLQDRYRVRPEREWHKVGGISRGASWSLHLGLKYWESFSAFGGHSVPVFYDDAPLVPYWLDAIPRDQLPSIYLDYAESDQSPIRRSANSFIEELDKRGIPYVFSTAPGTHTETYWAFRMAEYFLFYISGWE